MPTDCVNSTLEFQQLECNLLPCLRSMKHVNHSFDTNTIVRRLIRSL